jgi:tetratricopeptide (TPR) repeat protein
MTYRNLQAFVWAVGSLAIAGPALADALERCLARGDAALRMQACSEVIAGNYGVSDKARAHRLRAEARLAAGATADAIADYEAALKLGGDDAVVFAGRGQARIARGDTSGAIADLSEAIRLSPRTAFYRNARGHAHLVAGATDKALEDFSDAIRLDPGSASAYNNRGLARVKAGNVDAAIADYTQAIALNPLYALAYNNRGYAYEAKGMQAEAVADFNRALEIDRSLIGARQGLKRLQAESPQSENTDRLIAEGRELTEKNCGWCHATGRTGASPNAKAPPFRSIAARHPILALREPLSRGIAAPHDEMPRFSLPAAVIDRIIAYIDSLGVKPE